MNRDEQSARLDRLRGDLPMKAPNARSIASMAENPACIRRSIIDGALVNRAKLAERLGDPDSSHQSPFAISRRNQFERRVKENGAAELISLLRQHFGFEADDVRIANIGDLRLGADLRTNLRRRALATRHHLRRIAEGRPGAMNILDHSVTTIQIGGATAFLEQDALAFRCGDRIRVVEIKGFPAIDGRIDPDKAGEAKRQSAVYVLSVQQELASLGFDADLVDSNVVLVCPRNFSLDPTAVEIDTADDTRALRRLLAKRADIGRVLETLPTDLTLRSADESSGMTPAEVLGHIDANYLPGCLKTCELARFCRSEATEQDLPGRLGSPIRNALGSVPTIQTAIAIATESSELDYEHGEVATELRRARRAYDRAVGPRR